MPSPEMEKAVASLYEELARMPDVVPLEEWRAGYVEFGTLYPAAESVALERVSAAGVPAVWFTAPQASIRHAVLYLHGGGYVMGGIVTHHAITSRLSIAARARVLALDYRLAPEHRFPAAVEDAVAAYRWLLDGGIEPGRIAIAGDSAGGGLTVACLVSAREQGLPMPAAAVPISPWVDLTGETGWRDADETNDPMVRAADLDRMTADYIGEGDPRHPLAAPVHADLSGLPPMLVQVGTREILLTDATVLADRLRAAGVDVTLEIEDGAPHVWHHFIPMVPEAAAAVERIGTFMRARFAG